MRKSQASVALRPVEIPPLYRIWRIPPAYSVVHHEFLAIGRLNPVLCLDAILQVWQMSPGIRDSIIIIAFFFERSRLVDWLRVPTPMRANRVRAWVEVVGFVKEKNHFRVQWKMPEIYIGSPPWVKKRQACYQRENSKVTGATVYTKIYCRVQRNREFIPVQWESVALTMKQNRGGVGSSPW